MASIEYSYKCKWLKSRTGLYVCQPLWVSTLSCQLIRGGGCYRWVFRIVDGNEKIISAGNGVATSLKKAKEEAEEAYRQAFLNFGGMAFPESTR